MHIPISLWSQNPLAALTWVENEPSNWRPFCAPFELAVQTKYTNDIVKLFNLSKESSFSQFTPLYRGNVLLMKRPDQSPLDTKIPHRSTVGSLMYDMVGTRPDILP
ncbi:hypothetical protein QOT17_010336 [Balamuthia mandrillaris]